MLVGCVVLLLGMVSSPAWSSDFVAGSSPAVLMLADGNGNCGTGDNGGHGPGDGTGTGDCDGSNGTGTCS